MRLPVFDGAKMSTRVYRPGWLTFLRRLIGKGGGRRRRKSGNRFWKTKTTTVIRRGKVSTPRHLRGTHTMVPKLRRHDIVPGRTIVEWLSRPELGRGRVLQILPGEMLDVLFELGGRPAAGVPVEEVRVLA